MMTQRRKEPTGGGRDHQGYLVTVGASAGGIDALLLLVSRMPANFPAPIVVAQHLDPNRGSHLEEILSRQSTLPVHVITDNVKLAPGTVYVAPAGSNVQVTRGKLQLVTLHDSHPSPSVDLLFSSAAAAYEDRLIAVVLTGTGSDGAAGARSVKEAGGTVIIQDPATAAYAGMPLSLAPTTIDLVGPVESMGDMLERLVADGALPGEVNITGEQHNQLTDLLAEVRKRYGLDFSSYKLPTIQRRLHRRIVATGTDNIAGYVEYLRNHPAEYHNLVNSFLIKVTEFFRDPELFDFLRTQIVPDLIARARRRGNELRIWSAGCATGEEVYSLAIIVAESLGRTLDGFNVRIFATDADADAVAFARRGVYPAKALANMPPELISRYFVQEDDSYVVRKSLRTLVVFGQHDLGERAPFPRIDMVVCRNVMIYFTPELQQYTLRIFAYSVRDDGYLVLGKAESPNQLGDMFSPVDKVHRVFRRTGARVVVPPQRIKESVASMSRRKSAALRPAPRDAAVPIADPGTRRMRGVIEGRVLRLAIGIVAVDHHYDIQDMNAAARRYLAIHGPAIGEDLIHSAQGVPKEELRTAIDNTLRTGDMTVIEEMEAEEPATAEPRYYQVITSPERIEREDEVRESIIILFIDITKAVAARRAVEQELEQMNAQLESARADHQHEIVQRDQLIERLLSTNRDLMDANSELTTTNEDLREINEEFLLHNEEAQATNEELETLSEEFQATNEELETLNEELQATVEELNATNEDLNARNAELQEMALSADEGRARLLTILASIADGVLVVDRNGSTVMSNASYTTMFGKGQYVPLDRSGHVMPSNQWPAQRAARGETFSTQFWLVDDHGVWHRYETSGQPVAGEKGQPEGGVLVIRDITERDGQH